MDYVTGAQFAIDDQQHTLTRTLTYPGRGTGLAETYDGRGRLAGITYDGRSLIGSTVYDDADRLAERTLGNVIDPTYTYDPNGWLTMLEHVKATVTLERFAYDAENRLIRVTRSSDSTVLQEYRYDALGRRVATVDLPGDANETKTTHVYAGGAACIAEYDSTNEEGETEQRWFVHGPGFPDPLLMVDLTALGDVPAEQAEYLYYLKDLLGSVTALVNTNGTVVERYIYDPYGRTMVETGTYFHDFDLDGDVDLLDEAHFDACYRSSDPMCVFVHDRNGNQQVDIADAGMLAACVTTNGVGTEKGSGSFCRDGPKGAGHKRCLTPFPSLGDYTGLQGCQGSSGSLCTFVFDWNANGTVDNFDAAAFQQKIGHPGVPHPVFSTSSSYGNPFMWTGQRYDAAVGLYHFLFRSYSPTLGRWLQRDPLGYVDSASLYEYLLSNPGADWDPLGLSKGDVWGRVASMPNFNAFREYFHKEIKPTLGRDAATDELMRFYNEWVQDGKPSPGGKPKYQSGGRGQRGRRGGRGGRGGSVASAALVGLLVQQAAALNHVASSAAYRSLLSAVSRGDLNAADDWAKELEEELQAEGLAIAAGTWWKAWNNRILPSLTDKLNQLRGDQGSDDGSGGGNGASGSGGASGSSSSGGGSGNGASDGGGGGSGGSGGSGSGGGGMDDDYWWPPWWPYYPPPFFEDDGLPYPPDACPL